MVRKTIAELEGRREELEALDKLAEELAYSGRGQRPKAQRDARGRWVKGQSGNLDGRPLKVERSLTSRQDMRDFLEETEALRTVMTKDGPARMAAIELINRSMINKAVTGHSPSQRSVQRRRDAYIRELARADPQFLERMDRLEEIVLTLAERAGARRPSSEQMRRLNRARRRTRRR